MNQLQKNVLFLMERGGDNPNSLAAKAKAKQPNIFRILEGESSDPRTSTLQPLADYWGVSVADLKYNDLTDKQVELASYSQSVSKQARSDYVEIPQYTGVGGSMGSGVILRDQPGEIQELKVSAEWVSKNIKRHSGVNNLCIVTGFGTSMAPLYNPGDPLIIDRGIKTVEADAVYFFRVGEEGFIKILQRVPGEGIRVISKNKDYESWTIRADMDFEVFGLVLKAWSGTDVW
jgi:phage repressor protein C with HTH and peptisase S24 domain